MYIQIQHLLKLNFLYLQQKYTLFYIQIQHLLKLNNPGTGVTPEDIRFKYNIC